MTKILYFALKIKGGGREGGTCEVLRPCHPLKIWNVHKCMHKKSRVSSAIKCDCFKLDGSRNCIMTWLHCI